MAPRPPLGSVHVVVTAHDPKFLDLTLLGVAHQTKPARTVVISCDNEDPAFRPAAQRAADRWGLECVLLLRPYAGQPRPAQVRNNGVRYLIEQGAADADLIVFFDGDSCPKRDVLELHARYGARADLVIGQRYRLSESETRRFDTEAFVAGRDPVPLKKEQLDWINRRHRRALQQRLLQILHLNKPHKPKLLGANHAVRLGLLKTINGYDERFMGWGSEDDDLSRRAYRAGGKPAIALKQIRVYHQHHPVREQNDPHRELSQRSARRLRESFAARCPHGLVDPIEQGPVTVQRIEPSGSSQ